MGMTDCLREELTKNRLKIWLSSIFSNFGKRFPFLCLPVTARTGNLRRPRRPYVLTIAAVSLQRLSFFNLPYSIF